jgi:hypothetical protein
MVFLFAPWLAPKAFALAAETRGNKPLGSEQARNKEDARKRITKPFQGRKVAEPEFEQVVWVQNRAPQLSALYVLVPEATKLPAEVDKLVLRYAPAALREAERLTGPDERKRARFQGKFGVVFVIRREKDGKHAIATGFSIDQLREYSSVPEAKAMRLIRVHAWTFQKLPLINPGL